MRTFIELKQSVISNRILVFKFANFFIKINKINEVETDLNGIKYVNINYSTLKLNKKILLSEIYILTEKN